MRIRLKFDLPVNPKHGMTKGRELEVAEIVPGDERRRGDVAYWVLDDAGERVGVLFAEADIVAEE